MIYNITNKTHKDTNLYIIPIYENQKHLSEFNPYLEEIIDNPTLCNFINSIMEEPNFSLKYLQHRLLYNLNNIKQKVLLIGIGDKNKITCYKFNKIIYSAFSYIKNNTFIANNDSITSLLALIDLNKKEDNNFRYKTKQIILATNNAFYDIKVTKDYKDIYKQNDPLVNFNIDILVPKKENLIELQKDFELDKKLAKEIANSIQITKNLANLPANICTPEFIAEQSKTLEKKSKKISLEILDENMLESLGFGSFLSVSKSSKNQGKVIILKYNLKENCNPYVLIGKGITFDTGGYSLKPRQAMLGMKYDMCGAASVLGVINGIANLDLDISVVGIMACAENMVSKSATRPDDIVTSLSSQTIEINNTDAEGRLVLCDAITYAKKFNPKVIIDIATLTGAAVVALGDNYTACMGNNQKLISELDKASKMIYDPIWQLPLAEEYLQDLDSKFATMKNSSTKGNAGTIIGGLFLSKFVDENCPWAHLDIAGSSTITNNHEEATGRPVPLLMQYLYNENMNSK